MINNLINIIQRTKTTVTYRCPITRSRISFTKIDEKSDSDNNSNACTIITILQDFFGFGGGIGPRELPAFEDEGPVPPDPADGFSSITRTMIRTAAPRMLAGSDTER